MLNSIRRKIKKVSKFFRIPLIVSIILLLICGILLAVFKLNLDNDFTGGAVLLATTSEENTFSKQEIENLLNEQDIKDYKIKISNNDTNLTLEMPFLEESKHQALKIDLQGKFKDFEEASFETVGSIIGADTKKKAAWTISVALIGIIAYLAWAFSKVSKSESGFRSWHYGVGAIVALIHDLLITLGVFAILGNFYNVPVGTYFLIALLTILGYSVNDTIVVYDRLREQILTNHQDSLMTNMKRSVIMSLKRSAYTSITTLLALGILLFFAFENEEIKYFALALIIGITAGTYSSLFISNPVLYFLHRER